MLRKHIITTLLFLLCALAGVQAQQLTVNSFKCLPTDLDARVNHRVIDQNGKVCALIKVVNSNTGFVFDTGALSVQKVEQKVAEIWVYVQPKVRKITVEHSTLGILREYAFPVVPEEATVYEMVLESDCVHSNEEQAQNEATSNGGKIYEFTVNGVKFSMVGVEGDSFTMGATSEQGSDAESDEKPTHAVTLESYYIGQTEVTQELWQTVMGDNPSYFKGDNQPVSCVSWNDCQEFIRKLNILTGENFRLPTEAEWEYAARGGNLYRGYKYSGSNNIDDVSWHEGNSGGTTHPVGGKKANELGLYDMSGNVWEWCSDWRGYYSSLSQTNPLGASSGSERVDRGGSWCDSPVCSRVSDRDYSSPSDGYANLGLRLVLTNPNLTEFRKDGHLELKKNEGGIFRENYANNETTVKCVNGKIHALAVNGVAFPMVEVEGGVFTMGATNEQGRDADSDEKPAHSVTLNGFHIGQTEVTQALWQAVMGNNPSSHKGENLPVERVSWDDCQEFIRKLNALIGKKFRLPTEAEWEYAARGGNCSRGYKYSGSDNIDEVAWYEGNSGDKTQPVGTKKANELGLYDMGGNVLEWCNDWYGSYSSSLQTNPVGPTSGSGCVVRGGSWGSTSRYCRVSTRDNDSLGSSYNNLGLRLVLEP